ncbi:proteasome assembly chaperone family protein [Halobaculum halobium]|uniref:Proteasome assembly chaperone family protein n=1 Tax=Halobaculum halobium TaxID=3032281 RepID=A0ABD5TA47_9EURY|nr:PAC2 family protein [Halobaculum sp. SYNS20]
MGHIDVVSERAFDEPVLVEGFPGVGLVGKIVADHLVGTLDAELYATVHCDGLPPAAAYGADDRAVTTPVRLYAAPEDDLLVLQSDVPVSPSAAEEFADCIDGWFREEGVMPLYIAGMRRNGGGGGGGEGEGEGEGDSDGDGDAAEHPSLCGIGVGAGADLLDEIGVAEPDSAGIVSGPTGALLTHALETELPAVGLVAESDPQFPDPAAARVVLEEAVEPISGVDVDVETLDDQAERIQQAKAQLAAQLRQQDENVTQAQPLRMYQ